MASKHGKGTARIATARKLAITVFNMLVKKEPYNPQRIEHNQQQVRKRKIKNMQKAIKKLDIQVHELVFDS